MAASIIVWADSTEEMDALDERASEAGLTLKEGLLNGEFRTLTFTGSVADVQHFATIIKGE